MVLYSSKKSVKNQIDHNQYSVMKQRSTVTNLIIFRQLILETLDSSGHVDVISKDLQRHLFADEFKIYSSVNTLTVTEYNVMLYCREHVV